MSKKNETIIYLAAFILTFTTITTAAVAVALITTGRLT